MQNIQQNLSKYKNNNNNDTCSSAAASVYVRVYDAAAITDGRTLQVPM